MKRFIEGTDRGQSTLLPECLEDWVDENNPVRVIEVFVDELDLAELGFEGIAPEATGRPPWQNGFVERVIETIRRECLDHILILSEPHLRRVLTLYLLYYNQTRTHLGLAKDTPHGRAIQCSGTIIVTPILSGLHHQYTRIQFSGGTPDILSVYERKDIIQRLLAFCYLIGIDLNGAAVNRIMAPHIMPNGGHALTTSIRRCFINGHAW